MNLQEFFSPAQQFKLEDFQRQFRMITEANKDLFAQLMEYKDYAAWFEESQVDVRGMLLDCNDPFEGDEHSMLVYIRKASKDLLATLPNIRDDFLYEDVKVFWCMYDGARPRVFPHTIMEYMEYGGEGDTQFDEVDSRLVRQFAEL